MKTMRADYFAEVADEKTAGQIILRTDCILCAYSLPNQTNRVMVITDQGLKFCLKGNPEDFMSQDSTLISE